MNEKQNLTEISSSQFPANPQAVFPYPVVIHGKVEDRDKLSAESLSRGAGS